MKTTINVFLLLCLSFTTAFAGGTSDVGGGGVTIIVNGKPVALDIAEIKYCKWSTGPELGATLPFYSQLLASTKTSNWYLAHQIGTEVKKLEVCLTDADLQEIPAETQGKDTVLGTSVQQVAVRVGDKVYIDNKIFSKMSEDEQAVLLVHEASHALVPYPTTPCKKMPEEYFTECAAKKSKPLVPTLVDHHEKLRRFMGLLYKNTIKPIKHLLFVQALRDNRVLTITDIRTVESWSDDILIALDEKITIDERTKAAGRAEAARKWVQDLNELLIPVNEVLQVAISDADTQGILKALDSGAIINPIGQTPESVCGQDEYPGYGRDRFAMLLHTIEHYPEMALFLIKDSRTDINVSWRIVRSNDGYHAPTGLASNSVEFDRRCEEQIARGLWRWFHVDSSLSLAVMMAQPHVNGKAVYKEIIAALLKRSELNINTTDEYGETPLMLAVGSAGSDDVVQMLASDSRTDVCARAKGKRTARGIALVNKRYKAVRILKAAEDARGGCQ